MSSYRPICFNSLLELKSHVFVTCSISLTTERRIKSRRGHHHRRESLRFAICETLMNLKDDNPSGNFVILNLNLNRSASKNSWILSFWHFRRSCSDSGGVFGSSNHSGCFSKRFLPNWWVKQWKQLCVWLLLEFWFPSDWSSCGFGLWSCFWKAEIYECGGAKGKESWATWLYSLCYFWTSTFYRKGLVNLIKTLVFCSA